MDIGERGETPEARRQVPSGEEHIRPAAPPLHGVGLGEGEGGGAVRVSPGGGQGDEHLGVGGQGSGSERGANS